MIKLLQELLVHNDFLKLTRENPSPLPESSNLSHRGLSISLEDTGILQVEPENTGAHDIVISSGVHGNETAPIEICNQLVKEILSGELTVRNRILFIIGNPHAMNQGERFIDENLNRLFCGKHQGKTHPEARRAERLEQCTRAFYAAGKPDTERCHFDLHTAIRASKYEKFAIYPFQDGRDWNKKYLNFFKESGIETILLAHQPAGTFSYFSSHEFQANGFTVELGQVKPFGQNNMASFETFSNNLRGLINGTYLPQSDFENHGFNLFRVVDEVIRHSDQDFSLNIDAKIANFAQFPIGFQLTSDDNDGYQIKSDRHAIVFPNAKVPKGHRVALIVEKTDI